MNYYLDLQIFLIIQNYILIYGMICNAQNLFVIIVGITIFIKYLNISEECEESYNADKCIACNANYNRLE